MKEYRCKICEHRFCSDSEHPYCVACDGEDVVEVEDGRV